MDKKDPFDPSKSACKYQQILYSIYIVFTQIKRI